MKRQYISSSISAARREMQLKGLLPPSLRDCDSFFYARKITFCTHSSSPCRVEMSWWGGRHAAQYLFDTRLSFGDFVLTSATRVGWSTRHAWNLYLPALWRRWAVDEKCNFNESARQNRINFCAAIMVQACALSSLSLPREGGDKKCQQRWSEGEKTQKSMDGERDETKHKIALFARKKRHL